MEATKLIGLAGGHPVISHPDRLTARIAVSRIEVEKELAMWLVAKGLDMGLNYPFEKAVLAAQESLKKILEVYPYAMVPDIKKAVEMAAYGEIKISDQLTTISASNIFQWYKIFRSDHADKMSIPQAPPQKSMPEPTEEEKAKLARDFFEKSIKDPDSNIGGFDLVFKRILKMGLFPNASNAMLFELKMKAKAIGEGLTINTKDQQLKGRAMAIHGAMSNGTSFDEIKQMPGFDELADLTKKSMVKKLTEIVLPETIMKKYDEQILEP